MFEVFKQRHRGLCVLTAIACMLPVQSMRILAIACGYSTAPSTHWQWHPLLLCNPFLPEPVENGRRAFAVGADKFAIRRSEHMLSIRLDVVERRELH